LKIFPFIVFQIIRNNGRMLTDALHLCMRKTECVEVASLNRFFQWPLQHLYGPGLFSSTVRIYTETVGLLGLVLRPSQGRYLHIGQHKLMINAYTNIHTLSGIRTHNPSVQASEDSSCLTPLGHCDRNNRYL
jgi:hypothetical protein